MTKEGLTKLINQWENAKVDFKRQWYWNANMPKAIQEGHKSELVKDIIALTNGDVYSTNKRAYLVIGIDDETRGVYDFDKSAVLPLDKLKQQLLTLLNNYAQPEFLALDLVLVDEVLVISVPPRGSLISLSKDLKLKNNTDKKGTTYYRVGEDTRVASFEVFREFEKAFVNDSERKSEYGSLKRMKQGMLYAEAREILLDDGWQASFSRWQDIPDEGMEHHFYWEKGWQEIEACSPTGMGYCLFNFHDEHGTRLVVVTAGEDTAVYSWHIEEG